MSCRESDAILLYIVEKYDTQRKFSFDKFEDKMLLTQWIIFQASGQGYEIFAPQMHQRLIRPYSPYFGQAVFFKLVGPEIYRIPLAIERYQKETQRVFSVLDGVLAKQEWLVAGKATIADISFIT